MSELKVIRAGKHRVLYEDPADRDMCKVARTSGVADAGTGEVKLLNGMAPLAAEMEARIHELLRIHHVPTAVTGYEKGRMLSKRLSMVPVVYRMSFDWQPEDEVYARVHLRRHDPHYRWGVLQMVGKVNDDGHWLGQDMSVHLPLIEMDENRHGLHHVVDRLVGPPHRRMFTISASDLGLTGKELWDTELMAKQAGKVVHDAWKRVGATLGSICFEIGRAPTGNNKLMIATVGVHDKWTLSEGERVLGGRPGIHQLPPWEALRSFEHAFRISRSSEFMRI